MLVRAFVHHWNKTWGFVIGLGTKVFGMSVVGWACLVTGRLLLHHDESTVAAENCLGNHCPWKGSKSVNVALRDVD